MCAPLSNTLAMKSLSTSVTLLILLLTSPCWARSQGQLTACKSNLKNIGTACEMYATDNDGRYPMTLAQLVPDYLYSIPKCPTTGCDSYSGTYQVSEARNAFAVCCLGTAHHRANRSVAPNFPAYVSVYGLVERPYDANITQCQTNLKTLNAMVKSYMARTGHIPTLGLVSLVEKPDERLPHCSKWTYAPNETDYVFSPTFNGDNYDYEIVCTNLGHIDEGLFPLQPRLDSRTGLSQLALPHNAPSASAWLPVGVIIVGLTLYGARRRRRKGDKSP